MYLVEDTLDDLMHEVFEAIIERGIKVGSSSKGPNREINGVSLEMRTPLARLSRTEVKGTVFSCLGEFLWYLSGSNQLDFIKYYMSDYGKFSDDGKTVYGAYGPRIFGDPSQFERVAELLKEKPESRQAVIQVFAREDIIGEHKDVPCTCTLQFLIRSGCLTLVTHMRSNDAFLGFPHDVFAFSMIQELMARSVGAELGPYKHLVGSLHLYDEDRQDADDYIHEAWQSRIPMPAMPKGDPKSAVSWLLEVEGGVRTGSNVDQLMRREIDPYWKDLARLLQAYAYAKSSESEQLERTMREMNSDTFKPYLLKRIDALAAKNSK